VDEQEKYLPRRRREKKRRDGRDHPLRDRVMDITDMLCNPPEFTVPSILIKKEREKANQSRVEREKRGGRLFSVYPCVCVCGLAQIFIFIWRKMFVAAGRKEKKKKKKISPPDDLFFPPTSHLLL
jgi:hypothetical protein